MHFAKVTKTLEGFEDLQVWSYEWVIRHFHLRKWIKFCYRKSSTIQFCCKKLGVNKNLPNFLNVKGFFVERSSKTSSWIIMQSVIKPTLLTLPELITRIYTQLIFSTHSKVDLRSFFKSETICKSVFHGKFLVYCT